MGFFAAILSAVFSSSKDLLSKRLALRMDGTTSTFASFAFALPFYIVALAILYWLSLERFERSVPFLVLILLRSVTDTFAEGINIHASPHAHTSLSPTPFPPPPFLLLFLSPH